MKRLIFVLTVLLPIGVLLGGCPENGSTQALTPVCDALLGPIHYTTHNAKSLRYAAPKLAPDLAAHNSVGERLNCPGY